MAYNAETEKKIKKLIDEMTLEEKAGQLTLRGVGMVLGSDIPDYEDLRCGRVGLLPHYEDPKIANEIQRVAVEESRLGIPVIFCLDVIHGYRTAFPIPWSEAMSWESELAEKTASAAAKEATCAGVKLTFAPMVDIARNPCWGRICEGAGEDPYLGSKFAYARVKGFQGDDVSDPDKIAACAKHFCAYGFVEGGRDYNCVDMSESRLYNYVLPPFQACIDAGTKSIMAAFNDINGEPCTSSKWILTNLLRERMGFNGVVISDAFSVGALVKHGVAADEKEAAKNSLNAGMNVEMMTLAYRENLPELVKSGEVDGKVVDKLVSEVLRLKFELGLFDNPYVDVNKGKKVILCKEHKDLAQESAKRSIVLLENNGVLPLSKNKKIALIGPMADDQYEMVGEWCVTCRKEDCVTLKTVLEKIADVRYAKGCGFDDDESGFDEAVKAAKESDVIVYAIGQSQDLCGEARSRIKLVVSKTQEKLLKLLKKTGKPIVTIFVSGRPIVLNTVKEYSDAVLFSGALGSMAGYAYCDVIFGDYNPSAKLVSTFNQSYGLGGTGYYNALRVSRPACEDTKWCSKFFDAPIKPLYPFGYGLSYTNFEYEGLKTDKTEYKKDETVKISINVTNTGRFDGEEVVQVYVEDPVGSNVRPIKELKGYQKVFIKKGETKNMEFEIKISDCGYYNRNLEYVVESGKLMIGIGTNSEKYDSVEIFVK
ncbi:MAG: glycoside hydrolase family 3 C-terminal domain-containing protein [Oscillospiraceae bacterium]|nr:glycoside hydrolase family 3 C-terminal domain-containing protein [Oscillospiraceae bacterium]